MSKMKQTDILSNLPVPIVAIICSHWLKIQDVSRLDSAYCQSGTRAMMLGIISSVTMRGFCTYHDNFDSFMLWVMRRHFSIDSLTIPMRAFPWKAETMVYFLKSIGNQLKTMNISHLQQEATFFYSDISYFCTNLRELYVRDCGLGCAARSVLMNCQSLGVLDLTHSGTLTSHCFDGLNLPNLYVLRLRSCDQFICETLATVTPNLQKFQINGTRLLSPAGIQLLCEGCPHLREVRLPRSFHYQDLDLDADCVPALFTTCTKLESFDLTRQKNLHDSCFTDASLSLTKLRKLCIPFMHGLTDASLFHIAKNCVQLEVLGCEGCNFSDVGLAAIAGSFPQLHTLYIGNSSPSTMAGYQAALKDLPALKELGLYEVDAGDALLQKIGAALPQLRHVELQSCFSYTLEGLIAVACRLKSLVMTAHSLTDPMLDQLAAHFPRLDVSLSTQCGFAGGF